MALLHYLQIALLALIQGAAELLPVSSSAHVILAQRLMGMDPSRPEQVFLLVMLHTGTMFAVLVYFWPRWRRLWQPKSESSVASESPQDFLKMIVVATAVTGVVAVALMVVIERVILVGLLKHPKGEMEELFKNLTIVGTGLAAVGFPILAAGGRESTNRGERLHQPVGDLDRTGPGVLCAVPWIFVLRSDDFDRPTVWRVALARRRLQLRSRRRPDPSRASVQPLQALQSARSLAEPGDGGAGPRPVRNDFQFCRWVLRTAILVGRPGAGPLEVLRRLLPGDGRRDLGGELPAARRVANR